MGQRGFRSLIAATIAVAFGLLVASGSAVGAAPAGAAATGPAWSELTVPGPPSSARIFFPHVYDPVHDVLTIFGGFGTCAGGHLSDVWTLTGAASTTSPTWANRTPATGNPAGRWGSRAVYDPVSNRMIIFGGNLGCSSPATNEVLLLANANGVGAPPAWIPVAPAGPAPAPRSLHSAVYDPVSNSMIVQGGGNAVTAASYGDTWALRNANGLDGSGNPATPTWVQIPTSPALQFHDYATAVYNPFANAMIVYGGRVCSDPPTSGNCDGTQETNKVWTLSNANGLGTGTPTWTELMPTGTPPPAAVGQVATYDVANDRTIVFGGASINGIYLSDTWVLSGATGPTPQWQQLTPDPPLPPGRAFSGGGYDPALNRLLIFGGSSPATGVLSDTWLLSDANGITAPPPLPNVVINTSDSGLGSLRAAIDFANTNPGPDTISFAIPSADPGCSGGVCTIRPTSPLPALSDNGTTIDGSTQTAFAGDTNPAGPEIFLDGRSQVGDGGLLIHSSSNVVEGLTISGFPVNGINGSGSGINIDGGDGNVVRGNYIGTDPTGTVAIPNGEGVAAIDGATNTVIGGTTAAARNVISGNGLFGVDIHPAECGKTCLPPPFATGAVIEGNYIGTNATGTAALGNFSDGIRVAVAASDVTIGGSVPGAGNVISGNGTGHDCCITGAGVGLIDVSAITVEGNLIGTDAGGTHAVPNATGGVSLFQNVTNTVIGGATTATRNVISGNSGDGMIVGPGSTGNLISANYIGTDESGTTALGNGGAGVGNMASSQSTTITGNVVSGNGAQGVLIGGAASTTVQANRVGTNASGTAAVPNAGPGIQVTNYSTGTVIGGTASGAGNLISGNGRTGIGIPSANGVVVQGNLVGTDATGANPLPNGINGVSIGGVSNSSSNTIGGPAAGAANVIAFNLGTGVAVYSGTGNDISRNSIFSNGVLGIDLGGDGVTLNNCCGHVGPNNFQNFPVLKNANADPAANQLVVGGSIDTPNPTAITIEFFANTVPNPGADPSGHGEGAMLLGTVTPKANGKFTAMLPLVPAGTIISATATDPLGNTSEFAADVPAK